MPNYIRPRVPGATVFFTVALADRRADLLTRHISILHEAVRATREARPFRVDAWVVLPDHLHCIWTLPPGDHDFPTRWGAIKGHFSKGLRRAGLAPPAPGIAVNGGVNPALRKRQAGIWQKRFWEHHIRGEEDFANHVRYCWNNPVKHGYVERAVDWPYTSIHRDIRMGRAAPEWSGAVAAGDFGAQGGVRPAVDGCWSQWRAEPRTMFA